VRRLQTLKPAQGAKRERKRRGCGDGTGVGGTAGRGHKGQKARGKVHPWFEGGPLPIQRRLSHKGFTNARFREDYQVVNVGHLGRFAVDTVVTPDSLRDAGLISSRLKPVKILGYGRLTVRLTVCAHAFSEKAVGAITEAGGAVEVLG